MQSMTGFGSAQASGEQGLVTVEIKSVNSRYLDVQFRLPDELRLAEMPLRERLAGAIQRGKVEIRASFSRAATNAQQTVDSATLQQLAAAYKAARSHFPDLAALTFQDVLQWPNPNKPVSEPSNWVALCIEAFDQAARELQVTRQREGLRIAEVLDQQAQLMHSLVNDLKAQQPALMKDQRDRLATRLQDAFAQASPQGFAYITGEEFSQRLTAEITAFSLRADVAEELDRLSLHVAELRSLIANAQQITTKRQSVGKRLDFLFQEMNREANTLGSKAVHVTLSQSAIELKLLIEQMREQIQNIE
jgi:uncharacterized protein (TIGR00255 family)